MKAQAEDEMERDVMPALGPMDPKDHYPHRETAEEWAARVAKMLDAADTE